MPTIDLKKIRLDILIIIGFAALSLLFCYPQLQGKKLQAGDNLHWQAMSHEAMTYHDSTGKDVLWTNSMFGGMPSYTVFIGGPNHDYFSNIQTIIEALGKPAYFLFLAMLCFYILMRVLNVNRWLCAIGAIAYAFSSYNAVIIVAGHETKMLSLGYMPAVLAGFLLTYRGKWFTGAALTGTAMCLMAVNNHFQVLYYMLIMLAIAGVGQFIIALKEGRIKDFMIASGIIILALGIGAATNMSSILTTKEYAKVTMRGGESELSVHDKSKSNGGLDKDYAFRWSNGIGETFCAMIPYLYGGSGAEPADEAPKTSELVGANAQELPLYWGPQPFLSGPVYFGAAICFLFVLGLFVIRNPNKWWIVAVCALGIIMSWGSNFAGFNYFLFDHLPMLNKFRTPSMTLVLPELLFPVLGVWAIQEIIDRKDKDANALWKQVKIAAGITAGLCVLLGIAGGMFFNYTNASDERMQQEILKALKDDRASLAMKSCFLSAFYILAAGALIWAYLKSKIKMPVLLAGLGIVIAIDLIPVASHYLNSTKYEDASDYENVFQPRPVDAEILKDKDPYYRVLDVSTDPYNDAMPAYFHKLVGGYHPAKMEAYQDLIDEQMSGKFNAQVLNMLNTKYVIIGGQKSQPRVIQNPDACGNAWFVSDIKWAATADEEMQSLNANQLGDTVKTAGAFEPRKTAVVRNTFKDALNGYNFGKDSAANIKLAQYGLDDLSFTSANSIDGFAVFSDIYYPYGWKAYVDGAETPIVKVNYVLRGIKIPKGNHKIEFHFKPDSYYTGNKVAMISSILLLLLCVGAAYPLLKKNSKTADTKA